MITDAQKYIRKELGFKPTPPEEEILSDTESRIIIVAGGERGGKSKTGAEWILENPPWDLIWLIGEEYDVPRTEFEYLKDGFDKLRQIKSVSFPQQGPCSIELIGGERIATWSAKEPEKIGREAPTKILGCEAARMSYEAYLRLRGRLAEKRARMMLTGTLEGSLGWYPEYFERGQGYNEDGIKSCSLPSWSNNFIFSKGRDDPEILKLEREMSHDRFMERHAGVPCRPSNIIIPEFRNVIHAKKVEFNSDIEVEIAVDPGYSGACAVLAIQLDGENINIIDEIYLQGYITEEIISICKRRIWWSKVSAGAIDFAGRQHQAMPAPIEVWQKVAGLYLKNQKTDLEGMIDLIRTFMKPDPITLQPKIFINPLCKGLIAEMGGGKSPVENGGTWLRDLNTGQPLNKNDHACKALGYWLVNRYGYTSRKGRNDYGKLFLPIGGRLRAWNR